jgi:8-oxo-dGTP diphosphatase
MEQLISAFQKHVVLSPVAFYALLVGFLAGWLSKRRPKLVPAHQVRGRSPARSRPPPAGYETVRRQGSFTVRGAFSPTITQIDLDGEELSGPFFASRFPLSPVTVDLVICRPVAGTARRQHVRGTTARRRACNWEVLLITRGAEPYKGTLALPGGFVDISRGESCAAAAARELLEETGVCVPESELTRSTFRADSSRDPRGHTTTLVFACVVPAGTTARAGDDAARVHWVAVDEATADTALAFDHAELLREAVDVLLRE